MQTNYQKQARFIIHYFSSSSILKTLTLYCDGERAQGIIARVVKEHVLHGGRPEKERVAGHIVDNHSHVLRDGVCGGGRGPGDRGGNRSRGYRLCDVAGAACDYRADGIRGSCFAGGWVKSVQEICGVFLTRRRRRRNVRTKQYRCACLKV